MNFKDKGNVAAIVLYEKGSAIPIQLNAYNLPSKSPLVLNNMQSSSHKIFNS